MRKLLFLTLLLLLFSGCSAPPEPEPLQEEPEETFSLPETWRLEPLSAPGIVTEGREPVDVAPIWCIADISAGAAYQDGIFTLSNFHLYGNF